MEGPVPDLKPTEKMWGDVKNVSETTPDQLGDVDGLSWTAIRSWSTSNTAVKQLSNKN